MVDGTLAKTIAAGTSSGLSIIGALYILGRYWYARRVKSAASVAFNTDVTKELIHVLAWLDLIGALGRIFGTLPTRTFNQSAGEPVTGICKLQGFVVTFGDGSPIAWNLVMAFNLYRWVCRGEDQQMLQKRIKWYILGTLVFALTICFLALGFNKYGDAGNWCWIVVPHKREEELLWKLAVLYIWVLLGGFSMGVLLVLVKLNMQKRLRSHENEDAREAYDGVVYNLTLYITAFIVCWLPAVADRGYYAITDHEILVLSVLHASILPLQGFVNAVIYGKFHIWIGRHALVRWNRGRSTMTHSGKHSDDCRQTSSHAIRERKKYHLGTAKIFITTFDMNWGAFPQQLDDWVPAGKDLYVFSLQHCIGVQYVEQAIHQYLLRVNYPMAYRSITALAGTSVRGPVQDAAVCQIVFVNHADDASGNFQFRAEDGRMWAQTKTFKEVVGIPIRYFDASIAFVSCNLSASTETDVLAKHDITSSMVHSFGMDADHAVVDFPYLYHHTFVSGNLNYDIELPRDALINSVKQAYKAESLRRATDAAIETKLNTINAISIPTGELSQSRVADTVSSSVVQREQKHGNLPVEWSLLFFKSRNSLGRSSETSMLSDDKITSLEDVVYEEILSGCDDDLPFTLLQSPNRSSTSDDGNTVIDMKLGQLKMSDIQETKDDDVVAVEQGTAREARYSWRSFLDALVPSTSPQPSNGSARQRKFNSTLSGSRGERQKISSIVAKSQLVAENTATKWQELLRFDELRAAIEAKEVFCGFEEPTINFLPSFPRKIGASASFSLLSEDSCKDAFMGTNLDTSLPNLPPAYKDRILSHSLQDTKQRIQNVKYWLCESVATSTHKPVCSLYELEVDRFFSYETNETNLSDIYAGRHALREKHGVKEFKIKLANLDANLWTEEESENPRSSLLYSSHHTVRQVGSITSDPDARTELPSSGSGPNDSTSSSSAGSRPSRHRRVSRRSRPRSKTSLSTLMRNVLGSRDRTSRLSGYGPQRTAPSHRSVSSGKTGRSVAGTDEAENAFSPLHLELMPVDPVCISTMFPLPSEDVYALQRKVHEVAHSVQSGFQSSANPDEETEDERLAYTNSRTVAWNEARAHGVMHTAITNAVNGVIHIAICIQADDGHGGQGVLCIQEQELLLRAAPMINEAEPIPFDLLLTWGGKHVGYLHGDILSSF